MADDLDGVGVSSSVSSYHPGNQYRVRETDPDESGGGKDFYDGFLREKKDGKKGEEASDPETPATTENPIPTVERGMIHDDITLSQRAKKMMDHPGSEPENNKQNAPASPPPASHVHFKA